MRVLILYTELAGYVLGNIKRFICANPGAEILLVHYPVNSEAPFDLDSYNNTRFVVYDLSKQDDLRREVAEFNPEVILCSGWGNKFYLEIVKQVDQKVKKVLCFDNQWKGTLKQRLLALMSGFTFLRRFRFAWVPGEPQKDYAVRLGFKAGNVFTGLYPADTDLFIPVGRKKLEARQNPYPRVMISVARYIPQKDLPTLWKAFLAANARTGNRWVLNCFGLGQLYDSRIEGPGISHLGFKQPRDMEAYILSAGVFVLPSIEEPWGVAVHEMALSAIPLVLSDKVGAGSMFLSGSNGFSFEAGNVQALEAVLEKIMLMKDTELWEMAEDSYRTGMRLTSSDWSSTLRTIALEP